MHNYDALSRERIVTGDEYRLFSELIDRRFGIKLKGAQMLTFHMKASHRLAVLGIETYREYYDYLAADPGGRESAILLSHLINHDTSFISDSGQIRLLISLLTGRASAHQPCRPNRLRILSAASGTGQEVYTLSAVVNSCGFSPPAWDVEIIGIDIDPASIARAQEGRYRRDSFNASCGEGMFLKEYLIAAGDWYVIKPCLRQNVEFRAVNLVDSESFAGLGAMDIIFCRHVLGSMTGSGIQRAVRNLYSALSDDGYLFISASESLIQHTSLFTQEYMGPITVYRKNSCNSRCQARLNSTPVQQQGTR